MTVKTPNGRCYLRMSPQTTYGDMGSKGIGFKIMGNALYGEAHNGATRSQVDLETVLPVENHPHRLSWKFFPNTKVEWYVDGVLTKQLATNLPGGWEEAGANIYFCAGNESDNASQKIELSRLVLRREW